MSSALNLYQVQEEMDQCLELLSACSPRSVLEIGVANGGSLREWAQVAADDAVVIGVDIGVPEMFAAKEKQQVHLIAGNSHSPETMRLITGIQKSFDFLFIDGGHEYENVKADFEMYSPLVVKGGIIAFHDIVPGPRANVGGVPEYWQELKALLPNHLEIVKDWAQGGYGIGILFV